ncbi:MAG: CotH kinase family protein, partial [Verrucomicrobiales bacterium]|nr:CotH kinase family protein [Verrucomicrobiales bacterium]
VAIHLKGTSSFRPIGNKPALTLNFDKFVPGQTFHGLHQITLNNSAQDPTFISERLCREIFEAAGVPVPRANYAVLTLNGRNQGLYVLTEAYKKQFLRRYFKDVTGNLYEGGVLRDVSARMDVNSGADPLDQSDMKELIAAARDAIQNKRLDELGQVLDLDRFISMIALEIMLCHCDSYAMNRNNYRLYHDRDADRMIFMPHGMDRTFGIGDRCPVDLPLLPTAKGLIARAVLGNMEGRERYLNRIAELNAGLFDLEKLNERVVSLARHIRPALEAFEPRALPRHQVEVKRLLRNIAARKSFVAREIDAYAKRLIFDTTGAAKVETWNPFPAQQASQLEISSTADGRKALHIVASPEGTASWRAKVVLEPGQYRFAGNVMTRGVPDDPTKGARLSHTSSDFASPTKLINHDSNWERTSCAFAIRRSPLEVEFVCELKSNEGEAWFDLDSLVIWRVDD